MQMLLANVRTPAEREGDLAAQIASCRTGERRLTEIVAKYGEPETQRYAAHLLAYSEKIMRAALRELRPGIHIAEDFMDDDGVTQDPLRVRVKIRIAARPRGSRLHRLLAAVRG